ncbi:UDP-glucuronosyltransferase [Aphelenchoides fujianensis]|nr:UDP-glucuronosyltransferase [Aphelenchoides fujianensis]
MGSHASSMSPFLLELATAGFNVTLLEWNYKKDARDFGGRIEVVHISEHSNGQDEKWKQRNRETFVGRFGGLELNQSICVFFPIADILKRRWDLVVVDDLFTIHGMGIAALLRHRYGVPYILYATTQLTAGTAVNLGLGKNLAATPYIFGRHPDGPADVYDPQRFAHRLMNVLDSGLEVLATAIFDWNYASNAGLFGFREFSVSRFFARSSAVIADYAQWRSPIPEKTTIKSFASKCKTASGELPADLRRFVEDSASKGTIFVAFGTAVDWNFAPDRLLDAIFAAFEQLADFRVLFVYDGPLRNTSAHIRVIRWAPQLDVLAHPKTRVYVSHGGLKSTKEAVSAHVPVVYLPLYFEQTYNADQATRMGFALALNKHTMTAAEFERAIREVADDPKYKANVKRTHAIDADRPVDARRLVLHAIGRLVDRKALGFADRSTGVSWAAHFFAHLFVLFSLLIFLVAK